MKILLVEDSVRLAERIKKQLTSTYLVDTAASGKEALAKVADINYNMIILDLGLPDMHGLEVCKQIRALGVEIPILILTGEDNMPTRVKLLETGADDYMTKPFDRDELRARLTALSRRQPSNPGRSILTLEDLKVDTQQRRVYRNGSYIPLRRKEFDILEYLVANKGRVLTREMIINHAWDSSKLSWNSTVDVHIKHLRDKIDRPFATPLIYTAYGLGYGVGISNE